VAAFYLHPHHDAARAKQALFDVALTIPFLQAEEPLVVIVPEKPS
jgi:small conductance mechanosensitive channel